MRGWFASATVTIGAMHIIYAAIVAGAVSVADGHWSIAAAVPAPPLPTLPRSSCVVDETGSLRPKTIETLQQICLGLDQSGKGQLVVAVVRGLHGRSDIAALALELFREIQLGHRDRDDGVIVVFRPGPRGSNAIRVTIGYGLEGGMTDERLRSLLDELVLPKIRRNDADGALIALSERLVAMVIEEDASGRIQRHAEERRSERNR